MCTKKSHYSWNGWAIGFTYTTCTLVITGLQEVCDGNETQSWKNPRYEIGSKSTLEAERDWAGMQADRQQFFDEP